MSHGPRFLRSKLAVYSFTKCDDCGRYIIDVSPDEWYWNPNKRARKKRICAECHAVREDKREQRMAAWGDDHADAPDPDAAYMPRPPFQAMTRMNRGESRAITPWVRPELSRLREDSP
jgi:hypothetical protein